MVLNLDNVSAEFSQKILELKGEKVKRGTVTPNNIEKICTSSLGVIQEQGLYAGFLFLLSKSGKDNRKEQLSTEEFLTCGIAFYLIKLLNREELREIGCSFNQNLRNPAEINEYKSEILKYINDVVTADLKKLLLIKSLFEQILVYTRYGAKVLNVSGE